MQALQLQALPLLVSGLQALQLPSQELPSQVPRKKLKERTFHAYEASFLQEPRARTTTKLLFASQMKKKPVSAPYQPMFSQSLPDALEWNLVLM